MAEALIVLPSLDLISERLPKIFPEGTANRTYLVRDIAAKTIFVMFYTGAVEGYGRWVRPNQITKMNDAQSKKVSDRDRLDWANESVVPGKLKDVRNRWYSVDTRESIRDETLRDGLVVTGAVITRAGVPTTSSEPRYALSARFSALFASDVKGAILDSMVQSWQEDNLNAGALARIRLVHRSAAASKGSKGIVVAFPNGESRLMAPGPSSVLTKQVIESFCSRFLAEPAVVFLSESGNKIVAQDDTTAKSIGLHIRVDKDLPDVIVADLKPQHPLLVFVEVVHTDGAITEQRKRNLLQIAVAGGYDSSHVAFLTVFSDRAASAFRRLSASLAWGSFVWFASEPEHIMILKGQTEISDKTLSDLM